MLSNNILQLISVYANYKHLEKLKPETESAKPSCTVCPTDVKKLEKLIAKPEKLSLYFVAHKPDLNVVNDKGRGIVHYAAINNLLNTILQYDGVLIDIPDNTGMTPLMYAALKKNNTNSLVSLLDHGANILAKDKCGRGIIFYAMHNEEALTYLNSYLSIENAKHYSFAKSKLSC